MSEDFLIMKWEWLENKLSDEELNALYDLLDKASWNEDEVRYEICKGSKCPLQNKVQKSDNMKKVLLEGLEELKNCDSETALVEFNELLVAYLGG